MDAIDALGSRPERRSVFTQELLAETQDAELQSIVETAAKSLSTPIALVSLILDQVQFFKGHYGLPADLEASRTTGRDVSFCQFVVRDGEPFEVTDAPSDERVPQHLVKEYGIRSYLGVPIRAQDVIAGALCVIDTKPRAFSEEERQELLVLSERVNERLTKLTESRRHARLTLLEKSTGAALAELRGVLGPVTNAAQGGRAALTALRSLHRLAEHVFGGGSSPRDNLDRSLATAAEALEECENTYYDVEMCLGDAEDALTALEHATSPARSTRLSEVLIAGQELARHNLNKIGGAGLPDLSSDTEIYAPRPLAVSLLAASLTNMASYLDEQDASGGIKITLRTKGPVAEVDLKSQELSKKTRDHIAAEINAQLGEDATVTVQSARGGLRLIFKVVVT
jgi:hypothetical protein